MHTKVKSIGPLQGHWEENKTNWHEQKMVYCEACGVLIPKRLWVVEVNGKRHDFCGRDCARLYRELSRPGIKHSK